MRVVLCPMLTLLFPDGLIHFFAVSLMYYSISLLLSLCHSHTVLPKLLLYTFLFTLTLRIGENNSWASKFQRLG